jgi:hypothetical protein
MFSQWLFVGFSSDCGTGYTTSGSTYGDAKRDYCMCSDKGEICVAGRREYGTDVAFSPDDFVGGGTRAVDTGVC